MRLELAHDQLAEFFGVSVRWAGRTPEYRKRFIVTWELACTTDVLTTVERASVLRSCREKRDALIVTRDRLTQQGNHGDKHADLAARTLDAEVHILQAAIRGLWKQSGAGPPPEDL